jgi:hypothetical protein
LVCVGHASSPYITAFVARLWATISKLCIILIYGPWYSHETLIVVKHRFIIYASEDNCRLRGNQCVFEKPDSERGLLLTMISKALFGLPDMHRAEIETLWVDQCALSYSFSPMHSWRKHISDAVEDLKQKMSWVSLIAIVVEAMLDHHFRPSHSSGEICLPGSSQKGQFKFF